MSIENNIYSVYMHTTPSNKRYIGITKQKCIKRWGNGKRYNKQLFYKAIKKYGWDNIEHKILFENLTKEEAQQKEIELIAEYNSNNSDYGYNITAGGDGFNGTKLTEEHKAKISHSLKGRTPYNKGKKMSEEQHKRLMETRKTKKVICLETNEVFNSLKEASNKFQFDRRYISSVCRGVYKSTHNYHFKFVGGGV